MNGRQLNGKTEKIAKEREPSPAKKPSQGVPRHGSLAKCNDPLRDKVRVLLAEALEKVGGEIDDHFKDEVNACDPLHIAVSVESAMYAKLGKSNGAEVQVQINNVQPEGPEET
ncbi:Transcription elongation factor TFIIS [Linum perenne]